MNETPNTPPTGEGRRRWTEQIEVTADQLVSRVQEIVAQGNVRRLIIRQEGRTLLDLPLTVAAVGGVAGLFLAPMLAALVAIAGLVARVQLVVEREEQPPAPPAGPTTQTGPGEGI